MAKRIFHIISRLDVGGAERVAMSIAASQSTDMEHHIVEVMRGNSVFTQSLIAELQQKGIPLHRALLPVLFHWHYLAERVLAFLFPIRMLWLWARYKPDVIHTHTEIPDIAVWLTMSLFRFSDIKVVRTIHNTRLWSGMNIIGPRVERFMQRHNANIAISRNVQKAYSEAYGTMPPIIYNGVTSAEQKPYEGVISEKVNVCFAGRFEQQKGISTLCEIVNILKDDARYHFHVIGSGRLQPLVDSISALPNVTVCPPVHNIAAYMQSFDYLIMPSEHEGLSILALEASFNGLPVMINSCDGLTDTLPPDWPLKVHGNDIREWRRLFDDVLPKADRHTLTLKAAAWVNDRFSVSRMQEEYESFYGRI